MKKLDRQYVSDDAYEKYDDACFAVLMDGYVAKLGEEYIEENKRLQEDDSFEFPEELDEKCLRLINKTISSKKRRKGFECTMKLVKKITVVAAAFLVVLALSSTVLYNTVEAFRVIVVDYAINVLDIGDGSFVGVKANEENNREVVPTWLPEGYEMVNVVDTGDIVINVYSDGEHQLRYSRNKADGFAVDTENAHDLYETKVIDYEAMVAIKSDKIICCWFDHDSGYAYSLVADDLDVETILLVAENCYN